MPGNETYLSLSSTCTARGLSVKKCSVVLRRDSSWWSRIQTMWQPCNKPLKSLEGRGGEGRGGEGRGGEGRGGEGRGGEGIGLGNADRAVSSTHWARVLSRGQVGVTQSTSRRLR